MFIVHTNTRHILHYMCALYVSYFIFLFFSGLYREKRKFRKMKEKQGKHARYIAASAYCFWKGGWAKDELKLMTKIKAFVFICVVCCRSCPRCHRCLRCLFWLFDVYGVLVPVRACVNLCYKSGEKPTPTYFGYFISFLVKRIDDK